MDPNSTQPNSLGGLPPLPASPINPASSTTMSNIGSLSSEPKGSILKPLLFFILFLALLSGLVAAGYFGGEYYSKNKKTVQPSPTPSPTVQVTPTPTLAPEAENANIFKYHTDTSIKRDSINSNIKGITSGLFTTNLGDANIRNSIDALKASIVDAKKVVNDTNVVAKGNEIKALNEEYIELAEKFVPQAEEALSVRSNKDELNKKAAIYNQTLLEMSQLKIDIVLKVNQIVGYEAIAKTTIDSLKAEHELLKKSIEK